MVTLCDSRRDLLDLPRQMDIPRLHSSLHLFLVEKCPGSEIELQREAAPSVMNNVTAGVVKKQGF